MAECLFCKIVAGEIPGAIVYQDDRLVAFKDINPQAPMHVLIVPRRHIDSLAHLPVKYSLPHRARPADSPAAPP